MKKLSFSEIMGKSGAVAAQSGLTLDHLPDLLGEKLPHLPKNAIGRFRLMNALKNRFGPNYRSIPGVSNIMKEFDGHVATELKMIQLKQIKPKGM